MDVTTSLMAQWPSWCSQAGSATRATLASAPELAPRAGSSIGGGRGEGGWSSGLRKNQRFVNCDYRYYSGVVPKTS